MVKNREAVFVGVVANGRNLREQVTLPQELARCARVESGDRRDFARQAPGVWHFEHGWKDEVVPPVLCKAGSACDPRPCRGFHAHVQAWGKGSCAPGLLSPTSQPGLGPPFSPFVLFVSITLSTK